MDLDYTRRGIGKSMNFSCICTLKFSNSFQGIDHCPGFWVENVTTTTQVDHRSQPIIFHLERDPQEKYPIHSWTPEYKEQHSILQQIVSHHESHLEPTEPQLNWCDNAIMVNKIIFCYITLLLIKIFSSELGSSRL